MVFVKTRKQYVRTRSGVVADHKNADRRRGKPRMTRSWTAGTEHFGKALKKKLKAEYRETIVNGKGVGMGSWALNQTAIYIHPLLLLDLPSVGMGDVSAGSVTESLTCPPLSPLSQALYF